MAVGGIPARALPSGQSRDQGISLGRSRAASHPDRDVQLRHRISLNGPDITAGLARRITPAQWEAVGHGLAPVTGRMLDLVPAERAAALDEGPVTIDLDTTNVVYGRKKRGVAYNHQGQRVGRPHVAAWAETEIVLAADLGDGTGDPRATAPGLLRRALAALPPRARASGRVGTSRSFTDQKSAHRVIRGIGSNQPAAAAACADAKSLRRWPRSWTNQHRQRFQSLFQVRRCHR